MFQQPNWLRQLIRRNTKPITENQAGVWKKRLALGYALIAWNAFGIVCYLIYTGKGGWMTQKQEEEANMTPAQQWTKTLGIKDATVYRISGLKVQKYEVHNDFEKGTSEKHNIDSAGKIEDDKININ
ncbi:hypothetical protein QE152_g29507 [Popillia japonica]|uniref:Uncharacterized protein n=1 Tax=Popillia japonica TaxID=7064 RepID=A0AAW1JIN2_POPJA